jgi:hypothetical protein
VQITETSPQEGKVKTQFTLTERNDEQPRKFISEHDSTYPLSTAI